MSKAKVWRIHLKSGMYEQQYHIYRQKLIDFCLSKGIVGFGWRPPEEAVYKEEPGDYISGEISAQGLTNEQTDAVYKTMLACDNYRNDKGLKKALNAMIYYCGIGDYIWTRDTFGIYHLGRITGGYRAAGGFIEDGYDIDIGHYRTCDWFYESADVPGKVISCFIPSATIQRIHDDDIAGYCVLLDDPERAEKIRKDGFFSFVTNSELEDLVALYMQSQKGCIIVPSSRTRGDSTTGFEYLMIDKDSGRRAVAQVKSGNDSVDCAAYYPVVDKYGYDVWLFFANNDKYTGIDKKYENKIHCISSSDLISFVKEYPHQLSEPIRKWAELCGITDK